MPMTAREAALKALVLFRQKNHRSDEALHEVLKNQTLDARDASLCTRLFYGVIQNRTLCDFYIGAFSTVKPGKMEPKVLDILRLSVYQLLFLSKIPAQAAVSEAVALTRKNANPRAAGLVNAVLRKVASHRDALPDIPGDDIEKLATRHSHPRWLVEVFSDELGGDLSEAEALLKANNENPPVTVIVNTLKTDVITALNALRAEGAEVEAHPYLEQALIVRAARRIDRLRAFQNGQIFVQDAAAFLAVQAAAPEPGQFILDACAAPGGKSFAAAVLTGDTGHILARDMTEAKCRKISDGVKRLGLSNIEIKVADARKGDPSLDAKADLVIADVPCSGFGVIRKKPEIRYKTREEVAELPALQLEILQNLSRAVRPGGVLLYATCTLLPEENEQVVQAFLHENSAFTPEAFCLPGPIGTVPSGMITLWPHRHETDGFFIAKLRRRT
ncbi:16S rRNA (cytosine(967)-C(5))-methyltransferase RsmB [Oscillospiraceae bacterium CM]|nr:16S rRNA (cytosine(967)-C(5))-methyltransferase RsmB [Oscillospiraceae bacterium CM]